MTRVCPVCGSEESEAIRRIYMTLPEGIPLPDHYDIVSCCRCGFCYANTSAAKEDYDAYYTLYNSYSGQGESEVFSVAYDPAIGFIKRFLKPEDRILDIGFGGGTLLSRLHTLGYQNLTGLDPSKDSVDKLKARGMEAVLGSVYDGVSQLKNKFDAVIMTTVIEHLLYPRLAVEQAFSYLKDGGYLIVSVPDYSMCYTVQLSIPNQFNQEHINYFSETSFANLLPPEGQLLFSEAIEVKGTVQSSSEFLRTFAVQKHAGANAQTRPVEKDTKTKRAIERYLSQQEDHQRENERIISSLQAAQTPVIVWGTGSMTMSLLASTDLKNCNIVAFADGNNLKVGTRIHGLEVVSPQTIQDHPEATILVCAMQYGKEIQDRITELGLRNHAIFLN